MMITISLRRRLLKSRQVDRNRRPVADALECGAPPPAQSGREEGQMRLSRAVTIALPENAATCGNYDLVDAKAGCTLSLRPRLPVLIWIAYPLDPRVPNQIQVS
jgi:hypothetical protein